MLDQLAGPDCDKEDAAQWIATYIGKKHDASFTLACAALGTPLAQRLDEPSAEAMWSDANINETQQRITRRHLWFHCGKRLFIAEEKNQEDFKYYPTSYGSFNYYKDGDMSQKAEKCSYWSRDASLVVSKELERVIDYTKDCNVISRFSSCASSGLTIVDGADQ
jgi:hypothetical protein